MQHLYNPVAGGTVDPGDIVTHRLPIEQAEQGYMIRFLLSREESHNFSFMQAIETLKGRGVNQDFRDSDFSKKYMNMSTEQGDSRGPWNEGNGTSYEDNPNEKYGGPAQYGKDPQPDGKKEVGPGYNDHTRNNPQYSQPQPPKQH